MPKHDGTPTRGEAREARRQAWHASRDAEIAERRLVAAAAKPKHERTLRESDAIARSAIGKAPTSHTLRGAARKAHEAALARQAEAEVADPKRQEAKREIAKTRVKATGGTRIATCGTCGEPLTPEPMAQGEDKALARLVCGNARCSQHLITNKPDRQATGFSAAEVREAVAATLAASSDARFRLGGDEQTARTARVRKPRPTDWSHEPTVTNSAA